MYQRVTQLFNIQYPIIQAGMIWTSGWRLASAVSNAGGLGIIGSGSMRPDLLKHHISRCKAATSLPYAVNIPLLYPEIGKQIDLIIEQQVPIVFTSAGNPAIWTKILKDAGIVVVHVVSSSKFAKKAEAAGCDAVVAEGFEAGGHNGRDETTTMVLIPLVKEAVSVPVIAAGGIATGRQMLASMILGAEAVQVGSRFVLSNEASCHDNFKRVVAESKEGDTMLTLKELTPVRLLKNNFYQQIAEAYREHKNITELEALLGKGRSKKGMFEGDLDTGELEIGQVSAMKHQVLPAAAIVAELWNEFETLRKELCQ